MSGNNQSVLRVGVVEDESRLRELLVREIKAMGHLAEGFSTAEQAWPRIDDASEEIEDRPDLPTFTDAHHNLLRILK